MILGMGEEDPVVPKLVHNLGVKPCWLHILTMSQYTQLTQAQLSYTEARLARIVPVCFHDIIRS